MKLIQKFYTLLRPVRKASIDAFLAECSQIMHVGASTGQERYLYDRYNLDVLWIEPLPLVFKELKSNIAPFPKQQAVQALLADRVGRELTLHISSNNGMSSSIFKFKQHKDIWPSVYFTGSIQMKSDTIDSVADRYGKKPHALILDAQGAELLILKGAESVLRTLKYAKVEAPDFESYEGAPLVNDYKEFFRKVGMRLIRSKKFAQHPDGGAYYDLLFFKDGE